MSYKQFLVYVHDIVVCGLAIIVALCLRVGVEVAFTRYDALENGLIVSGLAALLLPMFSLNRGSWRYASIRDLLSILKATTTLIVAYFIVRTLFDTENEVPRSLYFLAWMTILVFLSGGRVVYRLYKEYYAPTFRNRATGLDQPEPVLLLGFTDLTEQFIRSNRRQKTPLYEVAGIIAVDAQSVGRHIHGVSVLGDIGQTSKVLQELLRRGVSVKRIVVGDDQTSPDDLSHLAEAAAQQGVGIARLADGIDEREGRGVPELMPFRIENLLGRNAREVIDSDTLASINGKRILVTGGGGSIGLELCRIIARMGPQRLIIVDNSELNIHVAERDLRAKFPKLDFEACFCDIRNREAVFRVVERYRPEIVIHAAAMKHVEILQRNPTEGASTNVAGAINVADAASKYRADAAVLISTDKAVRPTSVLGKTKRVAEFYFQHLDGQAKKTRFLIVRFGNVLGTTGSVVPIFWDQIAKGGPVTVTDPDVTRFFMAPVEAAQLVLKTIAHGLAQPDSRGAVFVLNMGTSVKIVDLARKLIVLAGRQPYRDVDIVFTGLKPGEKLHEELVDENESERLTLDGAIIVVEPNHAKAPSAARLFADLGEAIATGEDDATIDALNTVLGGFMGEPGDRKSAEIIAIRKEKKNS